MNDLKALARQAGINFDPAGPNDDGIDTWYGHQYLPCGALSRFAELAVAQDRAQRKDGQAAKTASLRRALEAAQRAINSMKVQAETAAQGDKKMMLYAMVAISSEGLAADMAIQKALDGTRSES